MLISTPHREAPLNATPGLIAQTVDELPGRPDPFITLEAESSRFIQVLWTPDGHILEFQDGSENQHFRCLRIDLTRDEVVTALIQYLTWRGHWKPAHEFERVELVPGSYRAGYAFGSVLGRVWRWCRRLVW